MHAIAHEGLAHCSDSGPCFSISDLVVIVGPGCFSGLANEHLPSLEPEARDLAASWPVEVAGEQDSAGEFAAVVVMHCLMAERPSWVEMETFHHDASLCCRKAERYYDCLFPTRGSHVTEPLDP